MTKERSRRKLSGILSADAVGYSRLMQEDEGSVFYLLEINDHWGTGEVVYWGGYVEDMFSSAVPSATLSRQIL